MAIHPVADQGGIGERIRRPKSVGKHHLKNLHLKTFVGKVKILACSTSKVTVSSKSLGFILWVPQITARLLTIMLHVLTHAFHLSVMLCKQLMNQNSEKATEMNEGKCRFKVFLVH